MDLQKSSTPLDTVLIFTKPVAIHSALAIYLFELFLIFRQHRLLPVNDATPRILAAKKACSWQMISSLWTYSASVLVVTFNGVPWLWALVGTYQKIYLPSLGQEFWRSFLFLLACSVIYMAFDGLLSFLRFQMLKDHATIRSRPSRRWDQPFYDVAKGKPLVFAMLSFVSDGLLFKAFGWKLQGPPFAAMMIIHFVVIFVCYPIYLQSRIRRVSPLAAGNLRDAMTESAIDIKFPLKSIDVFTGRLESLDQGIQLLGLVLNKNEVAIHGSLLELFTTTELIGLLISRLGAWKLHVYFSNYMLSIVYYSNAFTFVMLFIKQRAAYEAFGFVDEYPMIGGVVLFAVAMAKPFASFIRIQGNVASYKNAFIPDKYAADNGHLVELQAALGKIAEVQQELRRTDWLYSLYFNGEPSISERLRRLEKIACEKVVKEDAVMEKVDLVAT